VTTDGLDDLADAMLARVEIRDAAAKVLAREWSTASVRACMDRDDPVWSDELWSLADELGWRAVLLDDDDAGGTLGDLTAICESIGEAVAPLPVAPDAAAAWYRGRAGPFTVLADGHRLDVERSGATIVATGRLDAVGYGAAAERVLLPVDEEGVTTVVELDLGSRGVARATLVPLDRTPMARVELDRAELTPVSLPAAMAGRGAGARWAAAVRRHHLCVTAELVGVAARANDAAVAYAKERITFGRPIGSYQAIKHRLVDQRCAIEVARALVARAADAVEADDPDADPLTALACFWAVDQLRAVAEGALQVFGGIGFTWEHDAHLLVRRAAGLVAALPPPDVLRRRAIALHTSPPTQEQPSP